MRRAGIMRCSRGAAAVEFALVVPVLLLLLMGLIEMGIVFLHRVQVQSAAQAGIARAEQEGFDVPTIQAAVTSSSGLTSIQALPAPTEACGCVVGTTIVATACTSTCTGGIAPGTYVTVNARATYIPLFGLLYATSFTLNGTAVTRIR